MSKAIAVKEPADIERQATDLASQLRAVSITDDEGYANAVALRDAGKTVLNQVKAFFEKPKADAHGLWKWFTSKEKAAADPLDSGLAHCNKQIADFTRAKQAEIDRLKREVEAERQRIENERIAAEAKARQEAEAAREQEAADLEASDNAEAAAEVRAQEIVVPVIEAPAPVIAEPVPAFKPAVTVVDKWSARVTDLGALIAYVAANPDKQNYLVPNDMLLNSIAREDKDALAIPGVVAVNNPFTRG